MRKGAIEVILRSEDTDRCKGPLSGFSLFALIFRSCFGKTQPSMSMREWVKCSRFKPKHQPLFGTRGRLGELENEENRPVKRTIGILAGMATLGIGVYLGRQVFDQQTGTGNRPAVTSEPLRTRIAVVNVVQVLKKYSKYMNAQTEFQNQSQAAKKQLEPLEQQIRALQAKAQLPDTQAADREGIKRDLEHCQLQYREKAEDAEKSLAKKAGDLSIQFYKELEEAIDLFAKSNAIELVLMYYDASNSNPTDYYSPGIVNRRLTIVSAFMPIYVDPRMDITEAITQMLNRREASNATNSTR